MIIQGDDVQMNCVLTDPLENENVCSRLQEGSGSSSRRWLDDHQLLDLSRDVSSCLTVIACGAVVLLMDGLILKYADAILSIASLTILLSTTYPFVRESGLILLQSIPNHIDVNGLTKRLVSEFPDVLNVHDLHVWRLSTSGVIATVHIILSTPEVYPRIDRKLKDFFYTEGISSVTIQPEFTNGCEAKMKSGCILQCSVNNNCGALTCCGPIMKDSKECSSPSSTNVAHQCTHRPQASSEKESTADLPLLPQYDFAKLATALETTL